MLDIWKCLLKWSTQRKSPSREPVFSLIKDANARVAGVDEFYRIAEKKVKTVKFEHFFCDLKTRAELEIIGIFHDHDSYFKTLKII